MLELGHEYRQLQIQHPVQNTQNVIVNTIWFVQMVLPQVRLQKPCYDFSFLSVIMFMTFLQQGSHTEHCCNPSNSLDHSSGRSDGRCVQRAGTQSAQADDFGLLGIPRSTLIIATSYPHHNTCCRLPNPSRRGSKPVECISVARVEPRTSKGITDL